MKKRCLWICLLCLLACFFFPIRSSAEELIRVGVYEYYPLIFTEDDKVKGLYADVLEHIAKKEGYTLQYVKGTFNEGLKRLERGEIDVMTAIVFSPERERLYDFNTEAVFTDWGVLYKRKGLNVDSILDVEDLTVAVEKSDIYGEYFKKLLGDFGIRCRFMEVPSGEEVFEAILRGQAACGVVSRIFGYFNEHKYPVVATNVIFHPSEWRFAFPKGRQNVLKQVIDFNLKQMKNDPNSVLQASIRKWLELNGVIGSYPDWLVAGIIILAMTLVLSLMGGYGAFKKSISQGKELLSSKKEILREKAFFEGLFDSIPDAVALQDPTTMRIQRVNSSFAKVFGYSREEAEGRTLRELVVPEDRMHEAEHHMKSALEGKSIERVTVRRKKSGEIFHVLFNQVPLFSDGKMEAILNSYTDVEALAEIARKYKTARDLAKEELERVERLWEDTIGILAQTVEMKDPYTYDHQRRVSFLSEALAKKLGLSEERIRLVKLAGLVHDIGKVAVPAEILNKPGRLSDVEMEIVRTHPQKGYELLRKLTHRPVLAEIVYAHHERLDGSGYPRGLSGKDIPIEARILAVADVVEAMVSHRPFRSALTLEDALEEIKAGKGILYDHKVVEACVELFERGSFSFEDAPLS